MDEPAQNWGSKTGARLIASRWPTHLRKNECAGAVLLGEEFQWGADFQPVEAKHGAVFGLGENHGAVAAEHIQADEQARANRVPFRLHGGREFHHVAPDFLKDIGRGDQSPAIRGCQFDDAP